LQCDIGDAFESIESEPVGGPAQPSELDIAIWSNPDIVGKLSMEVKFGEVPDATQPLEWQRLIHVSIDEIEDATESFGIALFFVSLHHLVVGAAVCRSHLRRT
jgi:hypothetical protein